VRRLAKIGFTCKPHEKIPAGPVFKAYNSELATERAKEVAARRGLLEHKLKRLKSDTMNAEEVRDYMRNVLLPVRQRFMALPSECASMTNPTDPVFSHAALKDWVSRSLGIIRDEISDMKIGDKKDGQ
jgi:hypothetical protein